jgi:hypothetical protein
MTSIMHSVANGIITFEGQSEYFVLESLNVLSGKELFHSCVCCCKDAQYSTFENEISLPEVMTLSVAASDVTAVSVCCLDSDQNFA